MRRVALALIGLVGVAATLVATSAGASDSHTYNVVLNNAFGLVNGSQVRVAGVNAGTVTGLNVNSKKRAVVTISVSGPLSQFRTDATCSSQPQSLIAEYFLDCQPGQSNQVLAENGSLPVNQTFTSVQNDLVQNTLRVPFKERFSLIINEFGTALAGNPHNLNEAVLHGAPALLSLRKALAILAQQNRTIRDLNANSDTILARLAQRRGDVVRWIHTANLTAAASSQRRTDLARDFQLLPGFLAQLQPNLAALGNLETQQTPLLAELNAAAPQLTRLTVTLPNFNNASTPAINSLGHAANIGRQALTAGANTISALRQAGGHAYTATDQIANLVADLDNPKRATEADARAAQDTGRPAPTGYTGFEGLLNYAYYQTLAINQFDQIGHLLHFNLTSVPGSNACANYNAGPTVPAAGGGQTTSASKIDPCVAWLGPNQPGINQSIPLKPYDPSVCPQGSSDLQLCNPNGRRAPARRQASKAGGRSNAGPAAGGNGSAPGGSNGLPSVPNVPGLPNLPGLGKGLGGLLGGGQGKGGGGLGGLLGGANNRSGGGATNSLLNYLFGN